MRVAFKKYRNKRQKRKESENRREIILKELSYYKIVIVGEHNDNSHKRVYDNARQHFMSERKTFFETNRRENERESAAEHTRKNNRADGYIIDSSDIRRRNAVFSHFYRREKLSFGETTEFALKNEHIYNRRERKPEISSRDLTRLLFFGFEMSETKQKIRAVEKPERDVAASFRDIFYRHVYKRK